MPINSEIPSIGRIPIVKIWPSLPDFSQGVKAYLGEVIEFGATVFREGHDKIAVELELESPTGEIEGSRLSLVEPGLDRWVTSGQLTTEGNWRFRIKAWADDFQSWVDKASKKISVDVDSELMLQEGRSIILGLLNKATSASSKKTLKAALTQLENVDLTHQMRFDTALATGVSEVLDQISNRRLETASDWTPIKCDRQRAGFASWYEFFPRSEGAIRNPNGTWQSGTFKTSSTRLKGIADLGFDVIYLPPIHPIGSTHRKGKNNSLETEVGDPGSPWAIGNREGGHDTIHPDLGDEDSFAQFVAAAKKLGMEIALDFALQASPDHPWVSEHPEWFTTRVDGTIAYAENPPKKYQDIYPINFDKDFTGILAETKRILFKWINLGVTHFRVDNPHTKPAIFWQKLIAEVNAQHPQVVFLAEAFTRPAVMHALGQVGFQQSYSYFTWRNTKQELESYLKEVSVETPDFFRPNFWVNTPDILTEYLQFGGRPAFKIRAAIAATATPLWGMYSGFELYESVARPGAEESIDNEKYEYRPRDWDGAEKAGNSLAPFIRSLNQIRRENPALWQLRNTRIHWSDDDAILVYSKSIASRFAPNKESNTILVVANVDPHSVRETTIHLDLSALGLDPERQFEAVDLLTNQSFLWSEHNFVRLDSFSEPVHILRISQ